MLQACVAFWGALVWEKFQSYLMQLNIAIIRDHSPVLLVYNHYICYVRSILFLRLLVSRTVYQQKNSFNNIFHYKNCSAAVDCVCHVNVCADHIDRPYSGSSIVYITHW